MVTPSGTPPVRGLAFGKKIVVQTADISNPILATLSLDNNEFPKMAPQGTLIGNILGLTAGSTVSFFSPIVGAIQIVAGQVQVGPSPLGTSLTFDIQIVETLGNAVNSPNITIIPIIETDIAPTINTPPSIIGTPFVGTPLTAMDAVWNNDPSNIIYQWQAGGMNAAGAGATTLTYTPVTADIGKTLTITVMASNLGGSSPPSTSAPSAPVMAIAIPPDGLNISLQISIGSLPLVAA